MEACFFKDPDGVCGAMATYCKHDYENCSFYKSEKQYYLERNLTILKNRKKGLCKNCKYVDVPCDLIKFKEDESNPVFVQNI